MSFLTETFGRYEIKSGPVKDTWAANAFRRKTLIAKAVGEDREEAVGKVKAELERLDAIELSERDVEGAPSARVYETAFLGIEPINEGYRAMLRAHLHAQDRLLSATKLAEAAGYANYSAANLHYGRLGYLIAQEIGFDPPRREDGTEIWTCAIARAPSEGPVLDEEGLTEALMRHWETPHFEWQMRPQVADALLALGY